MAEEKLVIERELKFLLSHEVPKQWNAIQSSLTDVIKILGGSSRIKSDKPPITEKIDFSIPDIGKGFMHVDGYLIHSSKFSFRLPKYNKGNTTEAVVLPSDPFILQQLQRSHHLAEDALHMLGNFSVTSLDKNSVNNLIVQLEEVMATLQQSKEQLSMSMSLSSSFPATPQNYTYASIQQLQKSFHPALPDDIMVEYVFDDFKLVISVFGMSTVYNSKLLTNMEQPVLLTAETGEVVAYMVEKHSVSLHLPHVREGVRELVAAFKCCVRLRDKLIIHRQYMMQ